MQKHVRNHLIEMEERTSDAEKGEVLYYFVPERQKVLRHKEKYVYYYEVLHYGRGAQVT